MAAHSTPADNDVVVRLRHSGSLDMYELGTPFAPAQISVRAREQAVSQVLEFAKHQHVRAWFAGSDDEFVLLGTFREEENARYST
jgi:hypothetical protein